MDGKYEFLVRSTVILVKNKTFHFHNSSNVDKSCEKMKIKNTVLNIMFQILEYKIGHTNTIIFKTYIITNLSK